MEDVARHAGVSKATVSRVLNNVAGAVSPATAARIQQAFEELGYVPDAVAASLKARRTKTVGLVLTDLGNPFFATVAAGIESTIQDAGFSLIVASSGNREDREASLVRVMLERRIDALLVATAAEHDLHLVAARHHGIQVVLVDSYPIGSEATFDCVMVDNVDGAARAVRHLIQLGHERIGVVAGRETDSSSVLRVEGARLALSEAGLELPPELVAEGDFSVTSGREAGLALLSREPRPTAVFSANNLMTVGVLTGTAELGLRIPDDVSLVGFDDMDWYPLSTPAITAVAQPAFEVGARSAERLLLRLRRTRQPRPEQILLPTELVVRQSASPPGGGR
jgi:LacI family transcriptional regulator